MVLFFLSKSNPLRWASILFDSEDVSGHVLYRHSYHVAADDISFAATIFFHFNRHLGYYGFDLSRLTDYKFWIALPGTFPDFYYASELWQYTFNAEVPGIEGPTDMNMMFVPVSTPSPSPEASPPA